MAHAEKSYGPVAAHRRPNRSRVGPVITDVLAMLALAVVAGGLIGVAVYEGVRLLLDLVY